MKYDNAAETGPIYLVGMMGAGKSTVGPALAERLSRDFVDTDQAIEEKAGRPIAKIFEEAGEAQFRKLEREAIDAASTANSVVALGGGAFSQEGAPEDLLSRGIVIFLDASTELILDRIGNAASRPLLAGLSENDRAAKLDALRAERTVDYAKATFAIRADGSVETILDRIIEQLLTVKALSTGENNPSDAPNKRIQDG